MQYYKDNHEYSSFLLFVFLYFHFNFNMEKDRRYLKTWSNNRVDSILFLTKDEVGQCLERWWDWECKSWMERYPWQPCERQPPSGTITLNENLGERTAWGGFANANMSECTMNPRNQNCAKVRPCHLPVPNNCGWG